jgi:hypothetical protein
MAVSPALPDDGELVRVGYEGGPIPREVADDRADGHAQHASTQEKPCSHGQHIDRAVLAFVALGVVLRVGHYLSNYPIWGDEAFLALSFIRRGYLDLLLPLEYGQICPILFLWAELTAVKLFGFSEMSLRVCPLICSVASVFLFRHVAGRILKGPALLMAVAIFAVSIHPIRHSADVKPYATDLLMALVLLAPAIEWCVTPRRTVWLWTLAGLAPVALAASYPAVFVAGGIAIALAASVWRLPRRAPRIALAAFVLVLATTCAVLYVGYVHRQRGASLPAIQSYWADSFPPLDSPIRLASWLITTHAGSMFAYPVGGGLGASSLTLILVLIAAVVLWRQGRGTILALLVMPMGVALVAAALKLYPYGGEPRIMQYIAPSVCLLTGLASSLLLGMFPPPRSRATALRAAAVTLAVMGVVALIRDFRHPYRSIYDHQAREFARRFWPEQARGAELACLHWDIGISQRGGAVVRTALYLCNQHIYSPNRRRGVGPRWTLVTPSRPLRCVAFDEVHLRSPQATSWLESMKERYILRARLEQVVSTTRLDMKPGEDHVYIFEFQPKPDRPIAQIAAGAGVDLSVQ